MRPDFVASARSAARQAFADGLAVRVRHGVAGWAERFRRLASKSSAEPGPWRTARIPFLRGIMDALDEGHPAGLVVFEKSAQVGGSECGLNWLGETIDESPAPTLVLLPTDYDGKRFVRGRFHPMIASTPSLRKKIPLGRRGDAEGNTLEEKHFPGGVLYVGSANVPSDLSSVPIAKLLLDEVDRMPVEIEGEGDPVEIAKRRCATFQGRSKVFEISTPTDEETSRIDADYRASSRGRYFVPCPHCEAMQVLEFGNLRYTPADPSDARFACVECGALIDEHHKTDMLARGEWRHERPELCESAIGFHIWAAYTPIGLGDSWAKIAADYESVRRNVRKLRVFTNTVLGRAFRGARLKLEAEEIASRAEGYKLRTIPPGYLILTAGVDVQHDRVEVQVLAHGPDEVCAVVDYAVIYGSPTGSELWAELDAYLAAPIANSFGVAMRVSCALVDAGNWQHEVTNFTRSRRARGIFASKGASQLGRVPIGKPMPVDGTYRGTTYKRGADLYLVGGVVLEKALYARLAADAAALPSQRSIRFGGRDQETGGLPSNYFESLAGETFDPAKGKWVKRPGHERNEALDTFVLALAAAMHQSTQIHRMQAADWQRIRETVEPKEGAKPAAAPELGKEAIAKVGGFLPTSANVIKG